MRKILYSPGFGAGWTSWATDDPKVRKFMLEYPPFIKALENEVKLPDGTRYTRMYPATNGPDVHQTEVPSCLPIEQFVQDFQQMFPEEYLPYLGGLRDLTIMTVPDNALVRINEYDGSESVEIQGAYEGWL